MNPPECVSAFEERRVCSTLLSLPLALLLVSGCNMTTNTQATGPTNPQPQAKVLQVWTNNFGGIPFTMVGTDPSISGAGTTSVAVEIIPVTLSFSLANTVMSPESMACGDNMGILTRITGSPIFTNNTWSDLGIIIGQTQFPDAFQRANFWSIVSKSSPNYHVMLQPVSLLQAVTAEVPLTSTLQPNPNPLCPQPVAGVPIGFMDSIVQNTLATQQNITPDTLPIFITYNTAFLLPSGGLYLGYHTTHGNQTYVVASYTDPGFNLGAYDISDIEILSHELGEWMDNPLGINQVPPWGQFGIQPSCGPNLEVGDPLTSAPPILLSTPNFTYHIQELAYFSWFARNVPSLAINGRYSMEGTFTAPAPPCL